jgi:hypothetical protein
MQTTTTTNEKGKKREECIRTPQIYSHGKKGRKCFEVLHYIVFFALVGEIVEVVRGSVWGSVGREESKEEKIPKRKHLRNMGMHDTYFRVLFLFEKHTHTKGEENS